MNTKTTRTFAQAVALTVALLALTACGSAPTPNAEPAHKPEVTGDAAARAQLAYVDPMAGYKPKVATPGQ